MQVGDAAGVERGPQAVGIVGEPHAVTLDDVARAAHRGSAVIAVFDDVVTRPRHHERRRGADVEGVLAVAARADDVDGLIRREVRRTAHFEQRVAEPGQLLDRDLRMRKTVISAETCSGLYFPAAIPARTCCASERSMY